MLAADIGKILCLLCFIIVLNNLIVSAEPTKSKKRLGQLPLAVTKILDDLTNKTTYDKRLRPDYGSKPVDVGVTMHVTTLSAVSEVEMDYTLDFYLRQVWTDPRFAFRAMGVTRDLTIGIDYMGNIWVPDTFFPNEKKSYFHKAMTDNSFLRITADGEVFTSQRITVTAACNFQLHLFPMDSQECLLELESYGYDTNDINYIWRDANKTKAPVTNDSLRLPQFEVAGMNQRIVIEMSTTGNYSRLVVEFILKRNLGFYLMQIYLPSCLVVIISWVSFWFSRDASAARVSLGITTVLTMTTIMTNVNRSMPKVSYVKSIDYYLITCFLMVFSALVEYAIVSYVNKKRKGWEAKKAAMEKNAKKDNDAVPEMSTYTSSKPPLWNRPWLGFLRRRKTNRHVMEQGNRGYYRRDSCGLEYDTALDGRTEPPCLCNSYAVMIAREIATGKPQSKGKPKEMKKKKKKSEGPICGFRAARVDQLSRFLFPLIFLTFNIVYWIILYNISGQVLATQLRKGSLMQAYKQVPSPKSSPKPSTHQK